MLIAFAYANLIKNCNNVKLNIEFSDTQFDKSIALESLRLLSRTSLSNKNLH